LIPSSSVPSDLVHVAPRSGDRIRAQTILRQVVHRYHAFLQSTRLRPSSRDQEALRQELDRLSTTLTRLESQTIRIAVFGLVSRGKSAVLNGLIGQKILPTGPLHGVTQTTRSLYWSPSLGIFSDQDLAPPDNPSPTPIPSIELIDTPGLDEIDGQARAELAQAIARRADLILFVVAGDITRTEYQALWDLRQEKKPLLLVFNKIDLYPEQTRQAIYANLQRMEARHPQTHSLQSLLSAEEIVLVAAEPAPLQVRVELPDGSISEQWETPPPQIEPLRRKILDLLHREGQTLLALNALFQARDAEVELARKILDWRNTEAEALIWQFVRYKAIAVALNPIAVLDLLGGAIADLALIRALAQLYGLPLTNHQAGKLLKTILTSSGGLLLGELAGGLLGLGKSATAAAAGLDSATSFSAYASVAAIQGAIAGYGAYVVGRAAQVYLEQGCSWGAQGASPAIQDLLNQLQPNTILHRLRQELQQFSLE